MGVNWQFLTNSVTHATATNFKLEKILHNAYTNVECTYPRQIQHALNIDAITNESTRVESNPVKIKSNAMQQQQKTIEDQQQP